MPGASPARAASPGRVSGCPLCETAGGEVVWRNPRLRVVLPDEPEYPGFVRVIWEDHVAEMTELAPEARDALMRVVWLVEQTQRDTLAPDKINLASLGNMVPHLHWHVIPRWHDDAHFPQSVWSTPGVTRDPAQAAVVRKRATARLSAFRATLHDRLDSLSRA